MSRPDKAKFELVPKSESGSFTIREFCLPAFSSPWHFHEEYELTYIQHGTGRRFVGDSIGVFGPGDLVLVGSNLPHYWRNDEPAGDRKNFAHSVVVHFRADLFGNGLQVCPEFHGVRRLLERARRGIEFGGPTAAAASVLLPAMVGESGLSRLIGLLSLLNLLATARHAAQLASPGFSPVLDAFASERVNAAYQYIFQHYPEKLNYEAIARAAGMSLSAFSHYFRRVTGRTVSDFVSEVRIGHAHRQLIETDRTVAEVAFACGFESLSNFNRHFRERSGTSPSQYRARYQA